MIQTELKDHSQIIRQLYETEAVPWTEGYGLLKLQFIWSVLHDPALVDIFRNGAALPRGYGFGLDERSVEYPWVFSQLAKGPQRVLDAGSTLNFAFIADLVLSLGRKLDILTLAPEGNCLWAKGISYIYDDLRALPFRDELYDEIICISTLEHVGMDNTMVYLRRSTTKQGQTTS